MVVDGYKRMYDRLVAERGAMLDRTVDLEHRTRCMEALVAQLEGQLRAAHLSASQGRLHDPWGGGAGSPGAGRLPWHSGNLKRCAC